MNDLQLAQQKRRARGELSLEAAFNGVFDELNEHLSEADRVGPAARKKLMPILKKYAKSAHPFRECVRDQLKNGLGQPLANKRCAVLKDIIEGTTKWRGKKTPSKPLPQFLVSQEPSCPVLNLDDEASAPLDALASLNIGDLLAEKE